MLINWADAPRAPGMRSGAERRVVTSEQATVVHVVTEPNALFDGVAHCHDHEQWVVVTAGMLRFRCGDSESEMHVGDLVYVPPRQWHAATGVGPGGATYLEISTPPRLDLLPGSLVASPLEFEARSPAPTTSSTPDVAADSVQATTNPEMSHAR
jgi:quercetin dioxygenase-like cupin family protein